MPFAVRVALIGLALALPLRTSAAPETSTAPTSAGPLPSRRSDAGVLRAQADRLARALGGSSAGAAPSFALSATVQRADALTAAGKLDEAAALFEVAIDEGTRAPLRVDDPAALVRALVARASIGLARGELERAEGYLSRVWRWDPTFRLEPGEDSPRMRAALDRVRRRLGSAPPIGREDLGERCGGESLLLARHLDDARVEWTRYLGCRPLRQVTAANDAPEASLVAQLGSDGDRAPASASSAAVTAARAERRPVYRRAWFWVVTIGGAAALAGAGVGIWAATRGGGGVGGTSGWDVTPRF